MLQLLGDFVPQTPYLSSYLELLNLSQTASLAQLVKARVAIALTIDSNISRGTRVQRPQQTELYSQQLVGKAVHV